MCALNLDVEEGEDVTDMCKAIQDMQDEARIIGREEGREEGGLLKLISQVCRKMQKGKNADIIAEELEEELDMVETICRVAVDFAPEYDALAIYNEIQKIL